MGRYKLPYSIYKRGKYWYYRTYTAEGQRTTAKSTGCRNKGDAIAFCENLLLLGSIKDSSIRFAAYAHNFFNDGSIYISDRFTPLSANTIRGHRSRYSSCIEPYFYNHKLKDITYIELKKFRASLIGKGLKTGTVKQYLSTLKVIIDAACKEDLIIRNPFDKLESLEDISEDVKASFTLEQVKLLYKKIDSNYKNLVLLLALTGMRINEALGVTTADFHTTDKNIMYIKLNKQLDAKRNYVRIKTKRGRNIPVMPELKSCAYNLDINYKTTYKKFRAAIIELFGPDTTLSIHSLRHFFSTNSKAKNINPVKVKIIEGHVLEGSENTYTNFTPEDLAEIIPWQQETYRYITE